jgi:PPM family protein phosphatase
MKLESFAATDRGQLRSNNEDTYLVRAHQGVFAVADGMGGHAAGEVASRLAIDSVAQLPVSVEIGLPELRRLLTAAVTRANQTINEDGQRDQAHAGMGTTLTALGFTPDLNTAVLAHVGDSRAYRLRAGRLEQITRDHTWVQEQIDSGALAPAQARSHQYAGVLTRALGTQEDVDVDTVELPVEPGDLYLLCSDGLSGMLSDGRIEEIVSSGSTLPALANQLIAEANDSGGRDNITVVLVRVLE